MNKFIESSVSIVIPMHNEADNVETLLQEIHQALADQINFNIVVVDDGSTDTTWQCLQALSNTMQRLYPVRHQRNYGQSASIVTGVHAAPDEWIVTLDGDGQNHPDDIMKLVDILRQHHTSGQPILVAGNRASRHDTWLRRLSSQIANRVRAWFLRDHCPDSGCGIKAFRRSDFIKLPYFDHLHRFLPALFKRNGGKIVNISVQHRPRTRGYSKYGLHNRLWVGIVDLFGVAWLIQRPCHPEIEKYVASSIDP